jgi:hypothetical protein
MARFIFRSVVTNCFAGKNDDGVERFDLVSGQRLEARDAFDFVAEKFDAQAVFASGGADFDGVAAHAEIAALEGDVVAVVLQATRREKNCSREIAARRAWE